MLRREKRSLGEQSGLTYREGALHFDGLPVADLVERIGTPAFVISQARLEANYRAICGGLAAAGVDASLRYCVKTNNEAAVLRVLAGLGAGALVSHPEEGELALACGFPAERLAFHQPVLSITAAAQVLGQGVRLLHIQAPSDLDLIEEAAARAGANDVGVSLRVRVGRRRPLSPLATLPARYGLELKQAVAVAARLKASRRLHLAGLSCYVGTQQPAAERFAAAAERLTATGAALMRTGGPAVYELDLGGGLPSPTILRFGIATAWRRLRDRPVPEPGPEVLRSFAARLGAIVKASARSAGLAPVPRVALEPGRAIAGNAAVLLTRVSGVRDRWVFVDASRNLLPESSLLFVRRVLPVAVADGRPRRYLHLSGGTLNSADVLDLWRRLPVPVPGEVLALADAGAYSISRASRYAGLCPAVWMIGRDGTMAEVRRREGFADLTGPMAFDRGIGRA